MNLFIKISPSERRKKIKSAFISVFNKDNLDKLIKHLNSLNIELISTGGTEKYIRNLGIKVRSVQDLTNFPSILGEESKHYIQRFWRHIK